MCMVYIKGPCEVMLLSWQNSSVNTTCKATEFPESVLINIQAEQTYNRQRNMVFQWPMLSCVSTIHLAFIEKKGILMYPEIE